jgi:hypothetical protein
MAIRSVARRRILLARRNDSTSPALIREEIAMIREAPAQPPPPLDDKPAAYPAEKARGGEIILRTPWRRAIFVGGLLGIVILLLLLRLMS